MTDDIVATTERLILRGWREDDAEEFLRVTNTPAVMRWLGGVMNISAQAMQIARILESQKRNGFCFWIVERRADGAVLGFCGLKRADAPDSTVAGDVEIGWRLREDAWGQGYAKEAAQAALALAFTRFEADRVVALTLAGNSASTGLMVRLGLTRRADLDYEDSRFGPELNPTIIHVIERNDWAQRA